MAHEMTRRTERFLEGSRDGETLYILGGIALIIFGTGLILANPNIRKALSQSGIGDRIACALPDIQRYFRSQYL
jgi:hypothetical protein